MTRFRALFSISTVALSLLIARDAHSQCGNTTGAVPLIDLGPGLYQGFEGGLYPGGDNEPPQTHLNAALARAAEIEPLDSVGNTDPVDGKVVLLSIGMSNTAHSFSVFERQEDLNPARDPRLVILNGAQGGASATTLLNPGATYWSVVAGRLAALGLTADQVQVIWLKQAIQGPANDFPGHANRLRDELEVIVQNFVAQFPNVKLCYLSGRTYGGYNNSNPEPQAYENSFGVRWLIEDQIEGQAQLNFDPNAGTVRAPLLLWGPYLWADGETPRSDGLQWCACDFENCFNVHPAPVGEQKVGDLLSDFFRSHPTTQDWWQNPGLAPLLAVDAEADAHVLKATPNQNTGAEAQMRIEGSATVSHAYVRFDLSEVERPVRFAKLSFRVPTQGQARDFDVAIVPDSSWDEGTITWANAPTFGASFVTVSRASRDGTRSIDVTSAVNADADGLLSFVLLPTGSTSSSLHTRESGQPPRLILQASEETGLAFCFGDGGSSIGCTDCPCMNSAAQSSGTGCLNSTGQGARLQSSGAANFSNDTLHFDVTGGLPMTFGMLISANQPLPANPNAPCPAGSGVQSASFDGLRCAGGGFRRHGTRLSDANGSIGLSTNGWGAPHPPTGGLLAQTTATIGQTNHWQVFYRELPNALCMTGVNTTNGVSVLIRP